MNGPSDEQTTRARVLLAGFVVLFLAVQGAVLWQSLQLAEARDEFHTATLPVTDLANTQRQAERLRATVISRDIEAIEVDEALLHRQVNVTLADSHRLGIHVDSIESLAAQFAVIHDFIDSNGVAEIVADPSRYDLLFSQVDELSRVAKQAYDAEEQRLFVSMVQGIDQSSHLATALVALGGMVLLVGLVFVLQFLRRTRRDLQRTNGQLRHEIAERHAGEQRLSVAYAEATESEARAREAAAEVLRLHQVVVAGVGGGADEVAMRVARELVALHGFDHIGVILVDGSGAPRIRGSAGGDAPSPQLLQPDGPLAAVLAGAPATEVEVAGGLVSHLPEARVIQFAPILVGTRLIGALVVESVTQSPTASLDSVQRLADQLGLLFEAGRAFDDQRQLAERFRELDELKTEFVATVSHELRTPLTAIVGMAMTLDRYWDQVGEPERRDMVSRMRRQARRQQRLVDDLLTISRIQQRGVTLRPERVELSRLAEVILRDLEMSVVLDLPPGLFVWADRDHLERVITNYLTNAAKYAPEAPIVLSARDRGDHVEVVVRDHGPGVPEEFRAKLFESFTQASHGTTRTAQGVGLGLSIVRTLAEANGGRAWYRPGPDGGSLFGLDLPSPPAIRPAADLPFAAIENRLSVS